MIILALVISTGLLKQLASKYATFNSIFAGIWALLEQIIS